MNCTDFNIEIINRRISQTRSIDNSGSGILQRGEAIQLLREILCVCSATVIIVNSVSLISPTQGSGLTGYQLKIGTTLNDAGRNSLMPLLKEHEVEMEETKDFIVFYKRYL